MVNEALPAGHLSAEQGGDDVFRHACAMGLEGIVLKRVESRYRSGRCDAWRKVENPA
jgi:bifunctional non-homologous end joining protein LigD